ncbi:MAG: MFS transporter [Pseudomonadota bacterium]
MSNAPEQPPAPMRRANRVLAIVSVSQLVSVINASAMAVVAPAAALDLNADLPTAQWFVLGTFLAIAAFLVPAGRMGDQIGRKPLYIVGFVLLVIGNLVSATAGAAGGVILGRLAVGLGAAMQQGNSLPLLMTVFPSDRRASVIAFQVSVVGIGGVLGPFLGGLIVDAYGWRSLFYISVVLGAGMVVISALGLERRAERTPVAWSDFDWAGATLSATFLITVMTALTLAPRRGWTDTGIAIGFAVSALLFGAFLWRETRTKDPMLRLSLFRLSAIAIGSAASLSLFMSASAMRFLIPFHLQFVQGYSARDVGFVLVPSALALIVVSPFAGRLADRLGPRRVANAGLVAVLIAVLALTSINELTSIWLSTAYVMLVGVAMSIFHAPNGASMINSVQPNEHGVASAILSLSRNLGNVLGIALATVIVTAVMARAGVSPTLEPAELAASPARQLAFIEGMHTVFVIFACVVFSMVLVSLWRARDASPVSEKNH